MEWIRVDVDILRDPDILAAGRDAFILYVHGLTYAGEQETDGFVPIVIIRACPWIRSAEASAERLVERGLWAAADDGYRIRGWSKKQPQGAKAEADREAARERMRRLRKRRTSGERSPNVTPNNNRTFTTTVRDGTVRDEDLDPDSSPNGLVFGAGEPVGFAADQDQDPDQAVIGAFTPVLGDRLAFVWAKIARSAGHRWKAIIPEVFADLADKHGADVVAETIESFAGVAPDDLAAVDRPRAYVVAAVERHAEQAANVRDSASKT
jgi:hypothetical protein